MLKLVFEVARGSNNFGEGAIGFGGYGFVFRKFDHSVKDSFIIGDGSSKLCSIGSFKDIYKKVMKHNGTRGSLRRLLKYNQKFDLYFGGALRTLIPDIEFGGYESLYHVWMFVKTPQGKMFPATFYHGKSGASIGAWSPNYRVFLFASERTFPPKFESIINFCPFNFSDIELEEFIEALEISLCKVPISDFEGVYEHDLGKNFVGIRSGEPFDKFQKNPIEPHSQIKMHSKRKNSGFLSNSIMGNTKAWNLYCNFTSIVINRITPEELKVYPQKIIPLDNLIKRSFDRLVGYAYGTKSRLAFMVLGCFLMQNRSKMTEGLRQVILKYSSWEYEKHQFKNSKDGKGRKKVLARFRKKIKEYDGTSAIKLSLENISPTLRQGIDYSINE